MPEQVPYYLTEVDRNPNTVYCMHDLMGEADIAPHRHIKGQFLYTEGGVVHVTTEQKTFFLPARHYMWIAPGSIHSIHPGSHAVTMRNLYFPVEPDDLPFYTKTGIYPVNDLLLQMIMFTNRWNGDIRKTDQNSFRFALAIKAILPEISTFQLPLALPFARNKRLIQVTNFMNDHLHEPLTFPQLAKHFGFSERSLSRLFQQDLGMSFIQYFTLQRILRSLQLLLEAKMSVKVVAASVGYNSIPTFSTTFRKIVGVRPSEYFKKRDDFYLEK